MLKFMIILLLSYFLGCILIAIGHTAMAVDRLLKRQSYRETAINRALDEAEREWLSGRTTPPSTSPSNDNDGPPP